MDPPSLVREASALRGGIISSCLGSIPARLFTGHDSGTNRSPPQLLCPPPFSRNTIPHLLGLFHGMKQSYTRSAIMDVHPLRPGKESETEKLPRQQRAERETTARSRTLQPGDEQRLQGKLSSGTWLGWLQNKTEPCSPGQSQRIASGKARVGGQPPWV